ncbi:MAG: shikimate dehydrogenase [Desulfomonilaceae bacterium]
MKVYCVIGDQRVERSLSPIMHNSVFSEYGMNCKYVAFRIEPADLENAVLGIRSLNISGVNVTVPHKEDVIPFLDGLSDRARAIGAINTIVRDGPTLIGHNTDVGGFGDLLDKYGVSPHNSDVVITGAGGATRAVLRSFIERGYEKVSVINRTYKKGLELTAKLGGLAIPLENTSEVLQKATLLVNTTSVSEAADGPSFMETFSNKAKLDKLRLVIDINYGRKTNFWASLAENNGASFVDGLFMLAAQARRSFHLWTGENPAIEDFLHPIGLAK